MNNEELYACAKRHRECVEVLLSAIEEISTALQNQQTAEWQRTMDEERSRLLANNAKLRGELAKATKRIVRLERKVTNYSDIIREYRDRFEDTASNLGERCSQIKHLSEENRRLMAELDAAKRQNPRTSVIIPTDKHQPETPKTTRDMEDFEIAADQRVVADPKAGDVITRFTNEAARSPFIRRIVDVFGAHELKPEDFHLHDELAIPYVVYGNGVAGTFDSGKMLEAWIMADPKKRVPRHFGYKRGGKVVSTKGNSPDFWRLAYQVDSNQMLFFLAQEYRDVIEAFCSWYNKKVMP